MHNGSLAHQPSQYRPGLQQHRYLMAEDNPADEELVKEMLDRAFGSNYNIVCVDCFGDVSQHLATDYFDALILDMNLPDSSGIGNIRQINSQYPDLPIVVLTGDDDFENAIDSLKEGAQDYLPKDKVTSEVLARSLRYAKERKKVEQQLKDALDTVEQKNSQLESLVKYDHLTQLPNRAYFHDAAERILNRARRSQQKTAVLYFDLNGFKRINDTYGHLVGDLLLQETAKRLSNVIRNTDFIARLSGDEFVAITDLLDNRKEVYSLVDRVLCAFDDPFDIDGHRIATKPNIGVSFFPEASDLDMLIRHADCAMYEAKSNHSTQVCFYTEHLAAHYESCHQIESALGTCVKAGELSTVFQPVTSATETNYLGVESLIRWHSAKLGKVPPDDFIGIAESSPIINDITQTIIANSATLFHLLKQSQLALNKIAINISPKQLSAGNFTKLLNQWLKTYDLPNSVVVVELTERQIISNARECRKQILQLRNQGIRVALDDFGSGYSSITHLLDLPIDILKLDRVLVSNINNNNRNQALVAGIIEMAGRLGMQVVAEGIENEEEYDIINNMGCDYFQGYHIAKPMGTHETLKFFSAA